MYTILVYNAQQSCGIQSNVSVGTATIIDNIRADISFQIFKK
jgi:hypothetical protein